MYKTHFGLIKRPFRALAEGTDVFVGPQAVATIAALKQALAGADTIVAISGPVGVGKTAIVRRALAGLGDEQLIIPIGRIQLGHDEVLEMLLEEMGVEIPAGTVQRFTTFRRHLREHESQQRPVIIVVEDAARAGVDALSELEALTAADAGVSDGARIVLMGDDGMHEILQSPRLARLKQRLRLRQVISALSQNELLGYFKHCFRLAGNDFDAIFEPGSAQMLHTLSDGIPRMANNLVESCLVAAAESSQYPVSLELIQQIAHADYALDVDLPVADVAPAQAEMTTASTEEVSPAAIAPDVVMPADISDEFFSTNAVSSEAAAAEVTTSDVVMPEDVSHEFFSSNTLTSELAAPEEVSADDIVDDVTSSEVASAEDVAAERAAAQESPAAEACSADVITPQDMVEEEYAAAPYTPMIEEDAKTEDAAAPDTAAIEEDPETEYAAAAGTPVIEEDPEVEYAAAPDTPMIEDDAEAEYAAAADAPVIEEDAETEYADTPDTPAIEEDPEEEVAADSIQYALPDLAVLAPTLVEAPMHDAVQQELPVAPEPEPVPTLTTLEAIPAWERDPTLAELRPDLDALERAMAVAQGLQQDDDDEPEPISEVEDIPELIPEITLDRQIQAKIEEATDILKQVDLEAEAHKEQQEVDSASVPILQVEPLPTTEPEPLQSEVAAPAPVAEASPNVEAIAEVEEPSVDHAAEAEIEPPFTDEPLFATSELNAPVIPEPIVEEPLVEEPLAAQAIDENVVLAEANITTDFDLSDAKAAKDKKADAELEKIATNLARARTIDDCDDRMAETLFGEEFSMMAAQVVANAPAELLLSDSEQPELERSAAIAVPEFEGAAAINVELASEPSAPAAKLCPSASQRLATVRALNAAPKAPSPRIEAIAMGNYEAPPPVSSSDSEPDSIEEQINTSLTQTLQTLDVSSVQSNEGDDESKGGFFSRFRRS